MKLTPGKLAGLKKVSTDRGVIAAAAMDQRGSLQKSLAKEKGGDVTDDRRVMRKPERFMQVDPRRRFGVLDVDPLVDRDGPGRGNAVGHEHLPNRFGRGNEAVDLAILPPR